MDVTAKTQLSDLWSQIINQSQQLSDVSDAESTELKNNLIQLGEDFVSRTQGLAPEEKKELAASLFPDGLDRASLYTPVLEGFLKQAAFELPDTALKAGNVIDIQKRSNTQPVADQVEEAVAKATDRFEELAEDLGVDDLSPPSFDESTKLHDEIDKLKDISGSDWEILRDSDHPAAQKFREQFGDLMDSFSQGNTDLSQPFNPEMQQAANGGSGGQIPPNGPQAPGVSGDPNNAQGPGGPGQVPPVVPGMPGKNDEPAGQGWSGMNPSRSTMLMSLVNNPGIPIEQLVVMVVMLLAEDEDEKVREQFKQFATHEKRLKELRETVASLESQMAKPGADTATLQPKLNAAKTEMKQIEQTAAADRMQLHAKTQYIMQRRTEMFNLMTNLIKQFHDMAMAAIRNIRG